MATEPAQVIPVVFAWPRRGRIHIAAGGGKTTACKKRVTLSWHTGSMEDLPRYQGGALQLQFCANCNASQQDVAP